jgi:hypothetical protein
VALEPESGPARALLDAAEAAGGVRAAGDPAPAAGGGAETPAAAGHAPRGRFVDVRKVLAADVNTPEPEWRPSISEDGLELYFQRFPAPVGDLYLAVRESAEDEAGRPVPFGPARSLDEINSAEYFEGCPCIASDGLTLYFVSNRPDGHGGWGIYTATREAAGKPFGNVRLVIGTEHTVSFPSISRDGLELFFQSSTAPGGRGKADIYVATRATRDAPFGGIRNIEEINTARSESAPCISGDGLTLFWSDYLPFVPRPGGMGYTDIWMATRARRDEPFGPAVNLGSPVNTPMAEGIPAVSADWPAPGSAIYFVRCIPEDVVNTLDIYQAVWIPSDG